MFPDTVFIYDGLVNNSLHNANLRHTMHFSTQRYHMWNRNCLPFRNTCFHTRFKWSFTQYLFFCV